MNENGFKVPYSDAELEQYARISTDLRNMADLRSKSLPILGGLSIAHKFQRDLNMHTRQKEDDIPKKDDWHAQIKGTQSLKTYHKMISLMVADNLGPRISAFNKDYVENEAFSKAMT